MSLGPSGNETTQGRAAKLESDAEKRTNMALREVMKTAHGRRVLWAIVNSSGVFGYSESGSTPKRDFGVSLVAWFQATDPELYLQMQGDAAREAKDEQAIKREIEKDGESE